MPATPANSPVMPFLAVEPRFAGARQPGQPDQDNRPYSQYAEQLSGDDPASTEVPQRARHAGRGRSDATTGRLQDQRPDDAQERQPMLAFIEGIGTPRPLGHGSPAEAADPGVAADLPGSATTPDTPALAADQAMLPESPIDNARGDDLSLVALASDAPADEDAGVAIDGAGDGDRADPLRPTGQARAAIAGGVSSVPPAAKPGIETDPAVDAAPSLAGGAASERATDTPPAMPPAASRLTEATGAARPPAPDAGAIQAAMPHKPGRQPLPVPATGVADPAVSGAAGRLAATAVGAAAPARASAQARIDNDGPGARRPAARPEAAERTAPERPLGTDGARTDTFARAMATATASDPAVLRTGDGAPSGPGASLPAGPGASGATERGTVGTLPGVEASDSFAPLEFGADADAAQVTDQLADRVTIAIRRELQHAELQVRPAGLGPIKIDISMADGQANIQFTAAHPDTRQALQQSLPDLRDMLARQGIDLGRADVGQQSSGGASEQSNPGTPFVGTTPNSTARRAMDELELGNQLLPRPSRAGPGRVDLFA